MTGCTTSARAGVVVVVDVVDDDEDLLLCLSAAECLQWIHPPLDCG